MKILLLIALLVMVNGSVQDQNVMAEASLEQEFQLRIGSEATIEDTKLKIKFMSVSDDSRCPKGVDCIWHGNGKVELEMKKANKKTKSFSLNTDLDPKEASYRKYTIKLVRLSPDRTSDKAIDPDQYVATLVVSRMKKSS